MAQSRSWKAFNVRVSPWAWRSLAPAKSVGRGWLSFTSADDWASFSRSSWASGSNFATASATRRSVMIGPTAPSVRAASRWSTQRAPAYGRRWVCLGDAAGLPDRHLEPLDPLLEQGQAVVQVEGVADQLGARCR